MQKRSRKRLTLSRAELHSLQLEPLEARLALASDFGDAPAPFPTTIADGGASHNAVGAHLGVDRDMEANGQPSPLADGDGADEDGVIFGPLRAGRPATMNVNFQNVVGTVRLDAWIDFNGDGNWGGAREQIFDSRVVGLGDRLLKFDVPSWSISGRTYARVRVSSAGNLGHGGAAPNGEVEDYAVTISAAFGPGPYALIPTTVDSNAAEAFSVFAADIDADGDQDINLNRREQRKQSTIVATDLCSLRFLL